MVQFKAPEKLPMDFYVRNQEWIVSKCLNLFQHSVAFTSFVHQRVLTSLGNNKRTNSRDPYPKCLCLCKMSIGRNITSFCIHLI